MRLVIDMNLSPAWVGIFVNVGIEAIHWSVIGPANAPDTDIMAWASRNECVVFTHDLDFGTIIHSFHFCAFCAFLRLYLNPSLFLGALGALAVQLSSLHSKFKIQNFPIPSPAPGSCILHENVGNYSPLPMFERIEINPKVCNGRPIIRGSRVSVETILAYLSAGDGIEDVLSAHPRLEREDVLASIE